MNNTNSVSTPNTSSLTELKATLKSLALKIRELKSQRKKVTDGYVVGLFAAQQQYRYMHVVYSLCLGNTYAQIEPTVRPGNLLNLVVLKTYFVDIKIPEQYKHYINVTILGNNVSSPVVCMPQNVTDTASATKSTKPTLSISKMYVIVREDLSQSQQAVQAGHALAEHLLTRPERLWTNGTLVYLKATCHADLIAKFNQLKKHHQPVAFHESDLSNQMTAFACYNCIEAVKSFQML